MSPKRPLAAMAAALLLFTPIFIFAQATDGNLVGSVYDPSGAGVPKAAVELENVATGVKSATATDTAGQYRFLNVPVGLYHLTVSAPGFTSSKLANIQVSLNANTTRNIALSVGAVTTTVEVVESNVAIDTTTAQIANSYQARQATDLPLAANALGPLNLSLLSAGVASSGGLGLGEGPSIGGQRPRNNSFTIEGVDNNRKDVTGSNLRVPNESVAEMTILQNQFSAEFGHAGGGQFNIVVKGGGNQVHGAVYNYLQNRNLNAVDQENKRIGILENPRFDDNRLGGAVGGPVKKNKLFYFGNFEYNPFGLSGTQASAILGPTADGYNLLQGIQGLSRTNLDILKQYTPAAPRATDVSIVRGVRIPTGELPITIPTFANTYNAVASADYHISDRDQLRGRFLVNRQAGIDPTTSPALPSFTQGRRTRSYAVGLSEFHTFSPTLANELRLGYNRYNDSIPAGNFQYPGLDAFPNIFIEQDLNLQIGPFTDAPQSGVINTYQLIDNLNHTRGAHSWKFGVEGRKYIAPTNFVQRQRGDYNYSNLERYLLDLTPDVLAQRNLGGIPYSGNQINFYWFVQDSWRVRSNLTLNLGIRHEIKGIPEGDKLQALNASSSRAGLLDFRAPTRDNRMFSPRVGIAYSPDASGRTSFRAGFGISYDNNFDNFGTLSKPPQVESTIDDDVTRSDPGYLARGGIRPDRRPQALTAADALSLTSAYIPDQRLPYSIQWNFGIQRALGKDYTFEIRYLGTRGVRLFTQHRINVQETIAGPDDGLPTFLQRPSQADLDRLTRTLPALQAVSHFKREYAAAGLNEQPIVLFDARGNSVYHGMAAELTRRMSNNLLFKSAYTWSNNIDDSTADLFSTLLSPRRPQAFQNLRNERGPSFLDRRQRFTLAWIYDTPWYRASPNWFLKHVLGNYSVSGDYIAESGQPATVQSALDSNLNRDTAGDRAIVNPAGQDGVGSGVTALRNTAGAIVGYLANNTNARYIVAGAGVFPNAGRNTLRMPGINNWDLGLTKKFPIGEHKSFVVRAFFTNFFNHPQYIPGSLNTVIAKDSRTTRNHLNPGHALFNDATRVFSSNARLVQLVARFQF